MIAGVKYQMPSEASLRTYCNKLFLARNIFTCTYEKPLLEKRILPGIHEVKNDRFSSLFRKKRFPKLFYSSCYSASASVTSVSKLRLAEVRVE